MSEQTYSKEVLARAKKSGREPWSIQPKAKPTTDRRARLHRALYCVLDSKRGAARDGVIDPSTVSRVYSGRPGCMCGCQGNYSTNPATIKLICNKIAALGGESTPDWHTAETPSRSYTAYLKKGKYAKDSRPTHRD